MLHSLMMLTCLRVPVASHWLPSLKVGLSLSLYKYIYIYIHTYVTFDELRLRAVDRGIVPCYFRLFLLDCIRGAEKLREPEEQDHGGPGGGGRDMGRKVQGDVLDSASSTVSILVISERFGCCRFLGSIFFGLTQWRGQNVCSGGRPGSSCGPKVERRGGGRFTGLQPWAEQRRESDERGHGRPPFFLLLSLRTTMYNVQPSQAFFPACNKNKRTSNSGASRHGSLSCRVIRKYCELGSRQVSEFRLVEQPAGLVGKTER